MIYRRPRQIGTPERDDEYFRAPKYFYALGVIVIVFLVVEVLLASVPSSTVASSASTPSHFIFVRTILPQGWAFFTRDPRMPSVSVYQPGKDSWSRTSSISNSDIHEMLGANRKIRTEQYEIESLVQNSSSSQWIVCETDNLLQCLHVSHSSVQTVKTISEDPRFCGPVALVREDPVPWAWAQTTSQMPAELKFLNVVCEKSKRAN